MGSGKKIIAGLNEAIEHAKANTEQRNDAVAHVLIDGLTAVHADGCPGCKAWADRMSALSQPPSPTGEGEALGYSRMGSGGRCDFQQLREAVAEATCGDRTVRRTVRDDVCYPGHDIVPQINFNSLDRIVTAFVDAALSTEAGSGEVRITKEWCLNMAALEDGEIGAGMPDHPLRAAIAEAGKPAPSEPVADYCDKCDDSGYVRENGRQEYCDCICGNDAMDQAEGKGMHAPAPVEPAPSEERLREAASIIEQFVKYLGDDPWHMVGKARDFLAGISTPATSTERGRGWATR